MFNKTKTPELFLEAKEAVTWTGSFIWKQWQKKRCQTQTIKLPRKLQVISIQPTTLRLQFQHERPSGDAKVRKALRVQNNSARVRMHTTAAVHVFFYNRKNNRRPVNHKTSKHRFRSWQLASSNSAARRRVYTFVWWLCARVLPCRLLSHCGPGRKRKATLVTQDAPTGDKICAIRYTNRAYTSSKHTPCENKIIFAKTRVRKHTAET